MDSDILALTSAFSFIIELSIVHAVRSAIATRAILPVKASPKVAATAPSHRRTMGADLFDWRHRLISRQIRTSEGKIRMAERGALSPPNSNLFGVLHHRAPQF